MENKNLGFDIVKKKFRKLNEREQQLLMEKREIIRRTFIFCTQCNKKSRFSKWVFIQSVHDWRNLETECCHIVCPKCNKDLYLYDHPQRVMVRMLADKCGFDKDKLFREVKEREE